MSEANGQLTRMARMAGPIRRS